MPTSAEQLILDGLSQLRDEQESTREEINDLRSKLAGLVTENARLQIEVVRLNGVIQQMLRDRNGE